jgi:hypothetical protein
VGVKIGDFGWVGANLKYYMEKITTSIPASGLISV